MQGFQNIPVILGLNVNNSAITVVHLLWTQSEGVRGGFGGCPRQEVRGPACPGFPGAALVLAQKVSVPGTFGLKLAPLSRA